jgi:hypothetical protein
VKSNNPEWASEQVQYWGLPLHLSARLRYCYPAAKPALEALMPQALIPVGPLLYALILISLGIGLPIIVILAIRFLYHRHMYVGRSRELDKLIWQLHRIATALEHEKGLSFPFEPPGTEQGDAKLVAQRTVAAKPAAQTPSNQAPGTPAPGTPTTAGPEEPHRAGVNSMFGL